MGFCVGIVALPLGIVGMVYSSQVKDKFNRADLAGAQDASAKAKLFSIASLVVLGVSILLAIILFVVMFVVVAASAGNNF